MSVLEDSEDFGKQRIAFSEEFKQIKETELLQQLKLDGKSFINSAMDS